MYLAVPISNVGTVTGPTDMPERYMHTRRDGSSGLSDWKCSAYISAMAVAAAALRMPGRSFTCVGNDYAVILRSACVTSG